ncbi:hypothetical protein [Streptomyces sp. NBC_01500]|uniref:hypothetical protein n=1 Tax=Streptomyces sp. NBC_01500 TaxID=2903886 RepID=UPI002253A441|nr:hypothetical protein [Streptomyces sp. NBC_01500]MCX4553031.1 hypothetical protein [Streptomyces sp. NBC_01500]MCX4553167.1 hypothetical protein [Streptomyces sp. NBC_01500]
MAEDPVSIQLTHDQALVLSNWLYQAMHESNALDELLTDRAVWSAIYAISGTLDTTLTEIFMPDYIEHLEAARRRLLVEMYGSADEAETGKAAP